MKEQTIKAIPYKDRTDDKKSQVADMFNNISPKYDFLNHFLSLGIDIYWRKKAIGYLKKEAPKRLLDVATGTADFALEALSLQPEKIIGVDISEGMLAVGREKIRRRNLQEKIELHSGDSESLPFQEADFDAVTVAFGVRNFANLENGIREIHRVLRKNGTLIVLEFSKPTTFPLKQFYNFYFRNILPMVGRFISKDQSAYTYLPESVEQFPDGEAFNQVLRNIGFHSVKCVPLTFGISSVYIAKK